MENHANKSNPRQGPRHLPAWSRFSFVQPVPNPGFLRPAGTAQASRNRGKNLRFHALGLSSEHETLTPVEVPVLKEGASNVAESIPIGGEMTSEEEEQPNEDEQNQSRPPNLKKMIWMWPELKRRNAVCQEIEKTTVCEEAGVSLEKLRENLCMRRSNLFSLFQ